MTICNICNRDIEKIRITKRTFVHVDRELGSRVIEVGGCDIPFHCNYCGGTFCSDHRLPEQHMCLGLPKRSWQSEKEPYEETSSGMCAGCGRKFDLLHRRGGLYYCDECIKTVKIEDPQSSLASNAHFRETRKELLEKHPELMYGIPKEMRWSPNGGGGFKKDTGTSFIRKEDGEYPKRNERSGVSRKIVLIPIMLIFVGAYFLIPEFNQYADNLIFFVRDFLVFLFKRLTGEIKV